MPPDKQFWQIDTEKLASDLRRSARGSHTEEDFKMAAEPLIKRAFSNLGVDVDVVQYEKATEFRSKRNFADVVYGYLVIEYKAPGKLRRPATLKESKEELERYLTGEAEQYGAQKEDALEKMVGVSLDGEQILFCRFSRTARMLTPPVPVRRAEQMGLFPHGPPIRGFQFLGPYPVNASSLANLLIFARAAARRPLTAQHLASVFGPAHTVAQQALSELYSAVMRAQRRTGPSRVKTFFQEWDRLFGVVYGQELEKAEHTAEETARLYQMPGGVRLKQFLFAIHTYYAFLMKLIAVELLAMQRESTVEAFVAELPALDNDRLRERLSHLESGYAFSARGIENFLEADLFSWYLDSWTGALAEAIRGIVRALAEFEPATPVLEPQWTQDLLQKLYELIVPQKLRHDLGEYYTPGWLAGYLVDKAGYTGSLGSRFLDPACGSGTFLVQAIHRAIRHAESQPRVRIGKVAEAILDNIVGFDLNPLAVLAARTNYLIAFSRFIPYVRPISIPVYLCDSVVPPDQSRDKQQGLYDNDVVVFTTTVRDYVFPISMRDKAKIDQFTGLVDVAIRGKLEPAGFARRLSREMDLPEEDRARLLQVYRQIKELDDQGQNGIWAKYIKNAFAPVYVGRFDFVIGNPPWIRWGYLSDDYRKRTLKLWQNYGLFSLKGHEARLGAGEKDFSMLFTYACADRYLKDGGVLGFVITHEVFKSKGAGEGFRRFFLPESNTPLKVLTMEDMVDLKPFQAANKTSLFTLKRGDPTTYPLPVVEWKRKPGVGRVQPDWSLEEVLEKTARANFQAIPVDPGKPTSSWQTARRADLRASEVLKGTNPYKARLGARVEPYGVFWLRIKEVRPDDKLVIENLHDRGKRKVPLVSTTIESDLVYPAVSGGDLVRFGVQSHFYVLMSQDPATRKPYPESWMLDHAPLTHAYLKPFEQILLSRGSKVVRQFAEKTEFYAMYGIGEYTVATYRVTWKRMASKMAAMVLSTLPTPFGRKTAISTDTTSFMVARNRGEAHYLCAILNSDIVDSFIRSYSSAGRGFGAPSVMENLAIPQFNAENRLHNRLADLSLEAHNLVARGRDISDQEAQINEAVRRLWNISS